MPYGGGGPLSNARLLFDYGFCLPDNRADDVALPLACDGDHAAAPRPSDATPPPSASRLQLREGATRLFSPARATYYHSG